MSQAKWRGLSSTFISMNSTNLIALDADGVLIDYHEGYAIGWEKAFGYRPKVKNPQGYHPRHYWDVPALDESAREHFATVGMSADTWSAMPAMPGAVAACRILQAAGFQLVCV
jgi:phosphoglycolate phosphatase-like HAD superfamily hydrolase